ncbi:MAG: serine/threonine protein kinase, partial [Anaerolineae bacterium]|nr:serine/threonine protein kinase [Anaerolineae bacterium]
MDSTTANDLVGQEIRGYRFENLIAQGGFGQVYRAFQPVVERYVAIKVILPQYASQPNFVRRFELEAQLVAQLEHPYIVPMYDYWRDASGAYLIMRLLRGSLTQLLDRIGGPLQLDTAARMLDQIAAALTAAHRSGIIHRDLKPANVLLDAEENAYLADFGIAKRLFMMEDDSDFEHFGSPAYVAPEQVSGDVISAQADIYSLGIIVYEMLTGSLPYDAPSQSAILEKHLTEEVPSIAPMRPDLPPEVNY